MKTAFFSPLIRNSLVALLMLNLAFGSALQAQESSSTVYFEITKVKQSNDDFKNVEDELVKPFVQERIKQGNQVAHVIFQVLYPQSENQEYDYVILDVYRNFNDLHLGEQKLGEMAYSVFPNADIPKMIERYRAAAKNVGSQVFVERDEAVPGPPQGSPKFVQVNSMKVSEANSGAYAAMESEVFKPAHQERVKAGKMNDWILMERVLPYGSEWDNTFLTFDIFDKWEDIAAPGMGDAFAKAHPGKDMNELFGAISELRDMRRQETWEVLSVVNKPADEVTYQTVKEGTGGSPMKGQEIAFKVKMMDSSGKTLFTSEDLGFPFYGTLGENIYDRFFDRAVMQMKKGGISTITIPPNAQDKGMMAQTGGETAVLKVELVDFGSPKPDGAKLLEETIDDSGLSAAKDAYNKLQVSNPKGYVFREGPMNTLGYRLMQAGNNDAAIYILELNQKNYPKSWNVYDSLGDAYAADGEMAKAKSNYQMAVKINPDFQASKDKLEKL